MLKLPRGTTDLFWTISVIKIVCVFSVISVSLYSFFPDNYQAAESCAERKRRLRCVTPVDYDENDKKDPKRKRPKTKYARVKDEILTTIERMTNLNHALYVQNRLIDDLDEICELLDNSDSDSDSDEEMIEIEASSSHSYNAYTSSSQNLQIDREFSLEYGFTTDVSGLWWLISTFRFVLIIFD